MTERSKMLSFTFQMNKGPSSCLKLEETCVLKAARDHTISHKGKASKLQLRKALQNYFGMLFVLDFIFADFPANGKSDEWFEYFSKVIFKGVCTCVSNSVV